MVINPTHLAQRTRSCVPFFSIMMYPKLSSPLNSDKLARRQTAGHTVVSWMDKIRISHIISLLPHLSLPWRGFCSMNQIQFTCGKRRILIAELSYIIGSGDSANVFIEYASVRAANKDAAGVWETPICESVKCGGYVTISEPCRISGTIFFKGIHRWRLGLIW